LAEELLMTFIDEIKNERYNRNIIIEKIGKEGQKKIVQSKILVCGAGGLGSTVLVNLASLGVGTIGIVDDDTVELSNLNRQYIHKLDNLGKIKVESAKQWINDFNPDICVNTYPVKLNENNYNMIKDYDLIIDCFDSFESKFLLNKIAVNSNKTLIHGGITEFFGQVSVIVPQKTACLNCILPKKDSYKIKGVLSPAVSTIASIQAMEAVKVILNIGERLENRLLSYDGLNMEFKTINLSKNPDCSLCSEK
jgi:molybdopterin/thiamine biosynthesis adenylyltransferase